MTAPEFLTEGTNHESPNSSGVPDSLSVTTTSFSLLRYVQNKEHSLPLKQKVLHCSMQQRFVYKINVAIIFRIKICECHNSGVIALFQLKKSTLIFWKAILTNNISRMAKFSYFSLLLFTKSLRHFFKLSILSQNSLLKLYAFKKVTHAFYSV